MRQMAWQTIGPDELERIQQTIHLNLDAILAQGPRR
jgi:hypothetical protein